LPELIAQLSKPLDAPRSEDELRPVRCKRPRGGLAEAAARAGDDDNLAFDILHEASP
jgi:hypothetical protein